MKNKNLFGVIIIISAILVICVMALRNKEPVISSTEAETILQNYLMEHNLWSDDYYLEQNEKINNAVDYVGDMAVYHISVRFKDTVPNVGDRLISEYSITRDGNIIFWYDPANDEYIVQE